MILHDGKPHLFHHHSSEQDINMPLFPERDTSGNSLEDIEDMDDHQKNRTTTSSPDEMEDGFVLLSEETTAEWVCPLLILIHFHRRYAIFNNILRLLQAGDQTRYTATTPYQSAVLSAKQTYDLGLSYLQNSIDKAASVAAWVGDEAFSKALAGRREPSIMYIAGWEPPKNAFHRELSQAKSSREAKLDAYRRHLAMKARQENKSELRFVEDNEAYDAMGVSTAWRKPEKRQDDQVRRQRLLGEWKAKEERQARQRDGGCGRELDDMTGTCDRAAKRPSQLPKPQARGVSDIIGTRARVGAAMSTETAQKGMNFTAGMERGAAVTTSSRSCEGSVSVHGDGRERAR